MNMSISETRVFCFLSNELTISTISTSIALLTPENPYFLPMQARIPNVINLVPWHHNQRGDDMQNLIS
jgi:hypothetical protein